MRKKKILYGEKAKLFLDKLSNLDYKPDEDSNILGGVFQDGDLYIGFVCTLNSTYVEEFATYNLALQYVTTGD